MLCRVMDEYVVAQEAQLASGRFSTAHRLGAAKTRLSEAILWHK